MTSQSLLDQAALSLQNGDLWRAEFLYRQVIQREAFRFDAYVPLAMLLVQRGQTQEAAQTLEQALRLKPDDAIALFQHGNVLYALQRPHDALESYDKTLAVSPDFLDGLNNRAVVLCALDRFEEALVSLDRVLALNPANVLAHHNRGIALAGLERFEEAVKAYDAAIALFPGHADAWNNRGIALSGLQRFSESLESYDRALAINPNRADIHVNRGCALGEIKRFALALAEYDKALSLNPRSAEALYNRGVALTAMKRIEEALQSYKQCLALEPDYPKASYNLSLCFLQLGRFEEGFRLYESRKHLPIPVGLDHYPQPVWSGDEDIRGRTLLVRAEQGAGDIIQFSRYLALLQDRGANIILSAADKLIRLLRGLAVETVSPDRPPPDFDYQVFLMSLPYLLGTTLESIPAGIPYLAAEPDLVRKWKDRIGDVGFKIGIGWQTSASGAGIGKSFPLRQYAGLSQIPGVRLISLQRQDEAAPVSDLPPGMMVEQFGPEFDGGADAFIDSAALMQSLDLVITPDTAIAHLAGALGRPVWVALKYVPDWRWLLDRSDTPWYPTMRLFRQPADEDWDGLFVQMQTELAALIAGHTPKSP